uniref:Uncharacterized protein n=1 Tax=Oryza barthii TaxID=65489 RepID=A0A0D3H6H0_9ORYZ
MARVATLTPGGPSGVNGRSRAASARGRGSRRPGSASAGRRHRQIEGGTRHERRRMARVATLTPGGPSGVNGRSRAASAPRGEGADGRARLALGDGM